MKTRATSRENILSDASICLLTGPCLFYLKTRIDFADFVLFSGRHLEKKNLYRKSFVFIGFEVLEDRSIFSGIARREEG